MPEPETAGSTPVCLPARGEGTVAPAVSIFSAVFVVNGVEKVLADGDKLEAVPGDEVQVKEVTICAAPFSGNPGEFCVDFAPLDERGEEVMPEHVGSHMQRVSAGFTTLTMPDHAWIVGEGWQGFAGVLNHWPPEVTEDMECGSGRCEHDDRMVVGLR
jgi:hypothetical protein